jgi:hypothetical protein
LSLLPIWPIDALEGRSERFVTIIKFLDFGILCDYSIFLILNSCSSSCWRFLAHLKAGRRLGLGPFGNRAPLLVLDPL